MVEDNPSVVVSEFTMETFFVSVIAGGLAGMAADFVVLPIDAIKTRMQASGSGMDYTKQADSVSKYRGLASAMLASFPCAALFWLAYEYSKYFIHNTEVLNNNLDINTQHFIAASIGGFAEALSRCPFEVVKLNMQIGKYSNQSEAVRDIWKT